MKELSPFIVNKFFMSWRRFHGNGGSVDCHLIGETVIL
jgi:hypothetical protein